MTGKIINQILERVLVLLMAVLVLDVLWQVFSRYILRSPSSYTDELAGFLLIWVGLLGAAYVCGQKEHLAIDILLQRSRGRCRMGLEMVIHILTALFACMVMLVGGAWLMYTRFVLEVTSASLEINMGYVYLVLPLSGLLIIYYSVANAWAAWKAWKSVETESN